MASIFDLSNEQADRSLLAHRVIGIDADGNIIIGATEAKQDDIITAIGSQTGGVKWWYVRDTADATYEYTLFISTAGHIIRRETLSTAVTKQFTATETDDTTIDSNWSGRSGLSYTYV